MSQYGTPGRWGTTQTIGFSGSNARATNPFGTQTRMVRLVADAPVCVQIGDGAQTATTASPYLSGGVYGDAEYVVVTPGQSIAAIQASTDGLVTATSGTLWVTEITR